MSSHSMTNQGSRGYAQRPIRRLIFSPLNRIGRCFFPEVRGPRKLGVLHNFCSARTVRVC